MLRSIIIAGLVLLVTGHVVVAQTLRDRLNQRPNARVKIDDSDDKRNDLEGTIWEYKVIDTKTKQTTLAGKVRIKKTAVFAVATENKADVQTDKEVDDKPIKDAIAKRITAKSDGDGGDRIGDIVTDKKKLNPNEYTFHFDKDDEHELSGIAVIKRDIKHKGGVWLGYYNDASKKRWRFEMRKIED